MSKIKFYKVEATYEIDPIHSTRENCSWWFRVEILRDPISSKYFPRVYRCLMFTMQPTFPEDTPKTQIPELSDHDILVKEYGFKEEEFMYDSIEETLQGILGQIEETFAVIISNELDDDMEE